MFVQELWITFILKVRKALHIFTKLISKLQDTII